MSGTLTEREREVAREAVCWPLGAAHARVAECLRSLAGRIRELSEPLR